MTWLHWRRLPLHGPRMNKVHQVGAQRASPRRNFRWSSYSLIPKSCPGGPRNSPIFYSSRVINMLTPGGNAPSSGRRAGEHCYRKSANWGNLLKRLEQMYPLYQTDLSVRTKSEELPTLPKFLTAARIIENAAQLKELIGRMKPTAYGPTEHHLWLVGRIPPRTRENCWETSERKAQMHSYDDLIDLQIDLATERQNDSRMDK